MELLIFIIGIFGSITVFLLVSIWRSSRHYDIQPLPPSAYYARYLLDRPGDIDTTEIDNLLEMAKSESVESE